jgi:WD40 repeat protein
MSGFTRLQKFFRGYHSNVIKDICFSPNHYYLSALSATGTLHVFKIDPEADGKSNLVREVISSVNKFTDSESSFAKCSTRYLQKNEMNPSI